MGNHTKQGFHSFIHMMKKWTWTKTKYNRNDHVWKKHLMMQINSWTCWHEPFKLAREFMWFILFYLYLFIYFTVFTWSLPNTICLPVNRPYIKILIDQLKSCSQLAAILQHHISKEVWCAQSSWLKKKKKKKNALGSETQAVETHRHRLITIRRRRRRPSLDAETAVGHWQSLGEW